MTSFLLPLSLPIEAHDRMPTPQSHSVPFPPAAPRAAPRLPVSPPAARPGLRPASIAQAQGA